MHRQGFNKTFPSSSNRGCLKCHPNVNVMFWSINLEILHTIWSVFPCWYMLSQSYNEILGGFLGVLDFPVRRLDSPKRHVNFRHTKIFPGNTVLEQKHG